MNSSPSINNYETKLLDNILRFIRLLRKSGVKVGNRSSIDTLKSIKILKIQRQGKRPQNINEFMLGSQIKKGSNLNNA